MFWSFDAFSLKMNIKLIGPANSETNSNNPLGKIPLQLWHVTGVSMAMISLSSYATSLRSVILLIVADEAPSVLSRLPLPEEGLSDRLQLGQLKTDFLQVEGAAVLDLAHGERVHVPESDVHQLPGK